LVAEGLCEHGSASQKSDVCAPFERDDESHGRIRVKAQRIPHGDSLDPIIGEERESVRDLGVERNEKVPALEGVANRVAVLVILARKGLPGQDILPRPPEKPSGVRSPYMNIRAGERPESVSCVGPLVPMLDVFGMYAQPKGARHAEDPIERRPEALALQARQGRVEDLTPLHLIQSMKWGIAMRVSSDRQRPLILRLRESLLQGFATGNSFMQTDRQEMLARLPDRDFLSAYHQHILVPPISPGKHKIMLCPYENGNVLTTRLTA
jgi:hypothetical protein